MIENKPTTIVFLSSKTVEIVDANGAVATFTPELLKDFGQESEFKDQKAVLVLQRDLVFELVVPIPDSAELEKQILEEFIGAIPVETADLVIKKIKQAPDMYIWGTKKSFFEKVRHQLLENGLEVVAVVPVNALTKQEVTNISVTDVKVITGSSDLIEEADFLNSRFSEKKMISIEPEDKKVVTPTTTESTKQEFNWRPFVIGLVVLLLAGLIMGGFQVARNSSNKAAIKPTPTPTVTVTLTSTPTPTPLTKDKVRIQVLNGSGIVGQAGKVADALKTGGFSNVDTDNAPSANKGSTTVSFADRVTADLRLNITNVLQKSFTKVIATTSATLGDWDVQILTSAK